MIGICSLYTNPLHEGHLQYLDKSYLYLLQHKPCPNTSCYLIAILNNDIQVKLKGGIPFLDEETRYTILDNLELIDSVWLSLDNDESVSQTIKQIVLNKRISNELMYFFNSGDRKSSNSKEAKICEKYNIEQVFLDLPKINSSSEILDRVGREWHQRYMTRQTI